MKLRSLSDPDCRFRRVLFALDAAPGLCLAAMLALASPVAAASPDWVQRGPSIDGLGVLDEFGGALAVSRDGSTIVAGAPLNDEGGLDAGQVRVFAWDAGNQRWAPRGDPINGANAGDSFGQSVAVASGGSTIVVGAVFNDDSGLSAGQARVFVWDGFAWVQRGDTINGTNALDVLGNAVAVSGDGLTIVAGAPGNSEIGSFLGQVQVFHWNGVQWVRRGERINGSAADKFFGNGLVVSADGLTIVVGVPLNDEDGEGAGQVQVFHWDGVQWVRRGERINGVAAQDFFGGSVAVSADGSTIVAGASGSDEAASDAGQVRVFAWDAGMQRWVPRRAPLNGVAAEDFFGGSVAVSADGMTLVAGAVGGDETGTDAGQVRVFVWDAAMRRWAQRGANLNGIAAGDEFGRSVAISADGMTIAAGTIRSDEAGFNAGQVRVFYWAGSAWVQRGANLNGTAVNGRFGGSLAISGNGLTLVTGASRSDDPAPNAGEVRVFDWDGSAWTQRGVSLTGTAANDFFGVSVAVSTDGSTLTASAPGSDEGESSAGQVRVYDWLTPPPVLSCNGLPVTIVWGSGVVATSGKDVIWGTDDADTINALGGDDTVCGRGGDDIINGGPGNDTLLGGEGDDDLRGQGGADTLDGGDGVDQFFGGSGNDIITTGSGGNLGTGKVVRGQGNNDTITGSGESDDLEGGPGLDQLFGGDGDDILRGGNAADTLRGGPGADFLEGGSSNDDLFGGAGPDILRGGTGDDDLFGQGGDDTLNGQGGTDDCDGGSDGGTLGDSATNCETTTGIEL